MSKDLNAYQTHLQSRVGYFDAAPIHLLNSIHLSYGVLLFYYCKSPFYLGAMVLDSRDLKTVIWRSKYPLWHTGLDVKPLNVLHEKNHRIRFNYASAKKHQHVLFDLNVAYLKAPIKNRFALNRAKNNPILRPQSQQAFKCSAVFNSAAIHLDKKVHFIYRAIMENGQSVLGYGLSKDGIHVDYQAQSPIYLMPQMQVPELVERRSRQAAYCSGPNWCGYEDPRLTVIDDRIFMTFTAFTPLAPPYMAMTSISIVDFLNQQWNWRSPRQISASNQLHKNWVIFPEKIDGRYAILHSLTPTIQIAYLDNLETPTQIESTYCPEAENTRWDNWMRGVGPPPIKTEEGWLVLYHAMDRTDPSRYKLGAMLLDLVDPSKMLYRANEPLLQPDAPYENEGFKGGVIYVCGAVVIDSRLYVYYGAADTVLCVATIQLQALLTAIKHPNQSGFITLATGITPHDISSHSRKSLFNRNS